jgi:hypothetical protein
MYVRRVIKILVLALFLNMILVIHTAPTVSVAYRKKFSVNKSFSLYSSSNFGTLNISTYF